MKMLAGRMDLPIRIASTRWLPLVAWNDPKTVWRVHTVRFCAGFLGCKGGLDCLNPPSLLLHHLLPHKSPSPLTSLVIVTRPVIFAKESPGRCYVFPPRVRIARLRPQLWRRTLWRHKLPLVETDAKGSGKGTTPVNPLYRCPHSRAFVSTYSSRQNTSCAREPLFRVSCTAYYKTDSHLRVVIKRVKTISHFFFHTSSLKRILNNFVQCCYALWFFIAELCRDSTWKRTVVKLLNLYR